MKKLEKIDILNWEDDYFSPVLDGESWRLKYYTTDGTKKYMHGSNAYTVSKISIIFFEMNKAKSY